MKVFIGKLFATTVTTLSFLVDKSFALETQCSCANFRDSSGTQLFPNVGVEDQKYCESTDDNYCDPLSASSECLASQSKCEYSTYPEPPATVEGEIVGIGGDDKEYRVSWTTPTDMTHEDFSDVTHFKVAMAWS